MLFFDDGITKEQAGEYECTASNKHGQATAKTVIDVLCECKTNAFFLKKGLNLERLKTLSGLYP